jgi:hypothetical protein
MSMHKAGKPELVVNRVYRNASHQILIVTGVFFVGAGLELYIPISEGTASLGSVAFSFVFLCIAVLLTLVAVNMRIILADGHVVTSDWLGRTKMRVPFHEIVWVVVSDRGEDGWTCRVETRRGSFTFSQSLQDHLELAATMERMARQNTSTTALNMRGPYL